MSFDFNHHFDQGPLLLIGQGGSDKDFNLATFDPITGFGQRFLINVSRGCRFSDGLAIMEQCFLVVFDLHNNLVAGFFGCF
jgi:hypothetical protein